MSFGFPLGLLALAALAPLAAAYFLRRRQKPRVVSALFLWRSPREKAQAGPRFERFSREVTFLLEALAIAAMALFLADPQVGKDRERRHLVLVVDGSLSLSARPPSGPALTERVRKAAAAAVTEERATLLTIVESGLHPRLLAGPRAEASEALSMLEGWRPLGAGHDVLPALLLGKELAGADQRIWFFSDAALAPGRAPSGVQQVALGAPLENAAVLSATRRDEGGSAQVTVRVANFADAPRTLELSFEGPPRSTERLVLAAGASAVVRRSFALSGPIQVSLPDDALVEDGRVTLLPSPAHKVEMALLDGLGQAKAPLERFLQVAQGTVPAASPKALSWGPPGSPARVRVGTAGQLRSFVGPFFAHKGHPLLDDVGFGGVLWTAGDNPPGQPLLTAGEAVLMSEEADGTLHLNVELGRSNLQRTAAWPILLGNVLRRARQLEPGLPRRQLMLGEEVPVVTEPGARFVLAGPGGERPVLGVGSVLLPPLSLPGRYTLLRNGEPLDELELMALDPLESDLRGRDASVVAAAAGGGGLATRALSRQRALWPLFLLLGLLLANFYVSARAAS